jgi:hypothetical protein
MKEKLKLLLGLCSWLTSCAASFASCVRFERREDTFGATKLGVEVLVIVAQAESANMS